jgi:hypothetical protein
MDTWESCSIAWLFTDPSHTTAFFWADAQMRKRAYKLAQGHRVFQPVHKLTGYEASYALTQDTLTTEALDEFVSQLVESGWEALPEKGLYWWNRSFHREVTA